MNSKALVWAVVLIIILIGGWYWYSMPGQSGSSETGNTSTGDLYGSEKPDTRLVVGETIMGTWQDTTDAKFVREFKDFSEDGYTGTVVDWYDNEQVSTGTYEVYTKENPAAMTSIPLEDNAVYVRLVMVGTQSDALNFKVTMEGGEDNLQMTYMERGGVLAFKRMQ